MKKSQSKPVSVDDYIEQFPDDVQEILTRIREMIRSVAPNAEERISYQMPAFFERGVLIYFAAFKNHIGIFPPMKGAGKLAEDLRKYAGPKGNLKFPLNKPIPFGLIKRLINWRVKDQAARKS